jgi:hypothetical protein
MSRVRVQMRPLNFSVCRIRPSALALRLTQPLREISTRNLLWGGGKGGARLARKADNLTANCEPIVQKMWYPPDVSEPYEPPRPVTGIDLLVCLCRAYEMDI